MRKNIVKGIGEFLIIDSSHSTERIVDYIKANNVEFLSFNEFDGWGENQKVSDFSLLPSIKGVEIIATSILSKHLEGLEKIEYLYLSSSVQSKFDFSALGKLKYLNVEWTNKLLNLATLQSLEELVLRKYKTDSDQLNSLNHLKYLSLIQGNFVELGFLSSFKKLESLSLSHLSKLIDITGINGSKSLRNLEISNCKKIEYNNVFDGLNLQKLIVTSSSEMENLKFVKKNEALDFLSFMDTNVKDGNILPCVNLDYVAFDNKKNFNCTNKDGKAIPKP